MNSRILLVASLAFTASLRSEEKRSASTKPITAALQHFVDDHVLAGAVTLVADKAKVLDVETVGYADVAKKTPMRADDLFWIASMSKPMTAAAFMMLVDEGKVNVDDPVERYLPEFKGQMVIAEKDDDHVLLKKLVHPILVRNILSHTSGLAPKAPIETPTLDLLPLRVAVLGHASQPLLFNPDSDYKYSNAGINTAARIIEVVSGMPYEEFMQKRLFDPLGMTDTTFWPSDEQVKRIAKSYKANKDKTDIEETPISQLKYPLNDHVNRYAMPAGGLFSTAADCAKFCQMLLNGGEFHGKRLLSKEAVKKLTTKETADGIKNEYGFGFAVGGGTFGHGGAYSTNMTVDPKSGLITVFMVQNAGWRTPEGKGIEGVFRKAAVAAFAKQTGP